MSIAQPVSAVYLALAAAVLVAPLLPALARNRTRLDKRGGAAGGIGAELTAATAPHGYTLMLCPSCGLRH